MTTSGAGMLLSDAAALAVRCRYLSTRARLPVPHYEHLDIGYNYRLSNPLAALGRAQLRRLDEMIGRRRVLRDKYTKVFSEVGGVTLLGGDAPEANCWLTNIVVDPAEAGWTATDLATHLADDGIETRPVFKPMHLQPNSAEARTAHRGTAQHLFENGRTLPSGSALGEHQVQRVFDSIMEFLDGRR